MRLPNLTPATTATAALCVAVVALLAGSGLVAAQTSGMSPDLFTTLQQRVTGATSAGATATGLPIAVKCCDESHPISVSGEAEETVENTITKVAISVRVSDSIPMDTTPQIDINMQMQMQQNPQMAAAAQAAAARPLPTAPTAKQLDGIARSVMADANKRTQSVLSLLRATSAERLQTQGVSLQPTSVWVPKLNQQVNNGYSASNFITFRIASAAMGTLLADLMSIGATNIDSVTNIPTEEALETGRRTAIRIATKRALARAQLATGVMVSGSRLDIKNVQVTTSSSSSGKVMAMPAPMMMSARAELAGGFTGGGGSTTAAGETEVTAYVSLQVDLLGYTAVNQIAVNDVM